jgi:hypothetical protein
VLEKRRKTVLLIVGSFVLGVLAMVAVVTLPNLFVSYKQSHSVAPSASTASERGGDGGGGFARLRSVVTSNYSVSADELPDRKIVRTAFLSLLVHDAAKSAAEVEKLAAKHGGYIEKMEISQAKGVAQRAEITLRVPSKQLDVARSELKQMAVLVESDKTEARDVTKEFVDSEARLRNYQAEERQYLEIMRRATKVEDALNAADHLSSVRGQIEQLQASLKYLSQQVEMASVSLDLRVESVGQSARWRPWYQTKLAFADMVEGLIDFADSVLYFLLMLPVIVLWILAVLFLVFTVVKILAWAKRRLWPELASSFRGAKPEQP